MNERRTALSIIRKRFPALQARYENASSARKEAKGLDLKSRSENWEALLNRWLEGIEWERNAVYALSGLGDGSAARALLDRLPDDSYVFCQEKDLAAFRSQADEPSMLELLEEPRFVLGLGELNQDCFEALSRLPTLEIQEVAPLVFAPLYNDAPDYYASFFTEFAKNFDYWRRLYGTNVTAAGRWQANTLANAPILAEAPDIGVLKGAFKGCTLILVSAGPSLDESLDFIRENEDRCLVVAVNSSYRALRNAGISPRFVLAADPYEFTDRGFDGVSTEETKLICPFIVFPRVVERFKGSIFTWSQNHLLASYLRLKGGDPLGTEILEMGTVSACIFDIAKLFECDRIVFVGQDLAAKEDGQLHVSDSFYGDDDSNAAVIENCRLVPGNTIEQVPVEEKLYVYLKTFKQLAADRGSDFDLVNVSRLGARIDGIPYLSLAQASEHLNSIAIPSWRAGWARSETILSESRDRLERLRLTLDEMGRFADKASSLAVKSACALEIALGEVDADLYRAVTEARRNRQSLESLLKSDSNLDQVLNDGALKYELALYARSKARIAAIEDAERREAEDCLEYFWAVAEGCFSFASEVRSCMARLLVTTSA